LQEISKDHYHDIEYDELANILVQSVGRVLLEVYYVYF